jgi:ABC-2 type transport system permease protein
MISTAADETVRVSTARLGLGRQVREILRYRELLVAFTRTQLTVKYKNSVLGFVWSMLNPALYLVVFYVVFELILGSGIPDFPIFLLSGLLVWNLFSTALTTATGSVVASAGLVRKVSFPKEILPLAAVGAALVHFFLQAIVLVAALVAFRYDVALAYLPLLPLALFTLLVVVSAFGIGLAAANVRLRDCAHFVELGLLAWFWVTPIVYAFRLVGDKGGLGATLYQLNPVTWIVLTFQRALYARIDAVTGRGSSRTVSHILPADVGIGWYAWHLGVVLAVASVALVLALRYFGRVSGDFAEEL